MSGIRGRITLTLAIIACFVDAGLTTLSSLTPSSNFSSSILPSERAVRTAFSIFLTSLNLFFLDVEGLLLLGDVDGIEEDDDTDELAKNPDDPAADDVSELGPRASSSVLSSCISRL